MSTPKPWRVKLEILQGQTLDDLKTWRAGTVPQLVGSVGCAARFRRGGENASLPQPVDLTGCTARMHIRENVNAPNVLMELTTENGGIELGGALGTIRTRMSATATSALSWRSAVYDLEIVFVDGSVRRLLAGGVTVSPEVTR